MIFSDENTTIKAVGFEMKSFIISFAVCRHLQQNLTIFFRYLVKKNVSF